MTTKREGSAGYTLVELLAVLCIAGIVAALAIPSFGALARDARRTGVVNDLLATLRVARSEALKRGGRPLVICGIAGAAPAQPACGGADWSAGWILATWHDANANAAVDAGELAVLRKFTPAGGARLTVRAGNFMATPPIAPAGTVLIKAFGKRSSNGTITVCDDRGASQARAVIVSSLARARVSSKKADGKPLACP